MKADTQRRFASSITIVGLALIWYLATQRFQLVPPLFFPSPAALLDRLIIVEDTVLLHSAVTLSRVLASFFVGSLLGILLGLAMSRFVVVFGLFEPIVEALRPLPAVALIPFFILWFGLGNTGKIILAGLGCMMTLTVGTIEASRNVQPRLLHAARALGATKSYAYRTVFLPAILPELVGSFRVSVGLAFALTVAAELMGAQAGLGYLIMVARRSLNTDTILLCLVIIGLEAWLTDRLLAVVTTRLTLWSGRDREN